MTDPDHRDAGSARLPDQAVDDDEHLVAPMRLGDHAVLQIDDDEREIGTIGEGGHGRRGLARGKP